MQRSPNATVARVMPPGQDETIHTELYAKKEWIQRISITIKWAAHATPATIEDVCIDHGGGQITVSEEFLHRTDIVAVFQKMRRKTVPEGMAGHSLGDVCKLGGTLDRLLQSAFIEMVASYRTRAWVGRALLSWKDVLPWWVQRCSSIWYRELAHYYKAIRRWPRPNKPIQPTPLRVDESMPILASRYTRTLFRISRRRG